VVPWCRLLPNQYLVTWRSGRLYVVLAVGLNL
jgi:hypothetical protein